MIINLRDTTTYLISLKDNLDKRANAINALQNSGIQNIEIFDGIKRNPGRTGLAMSYKKILSKNIGHEYPLLICEEDVLKNPDQNLISIDIPDNADVVYLGIDRHGYCSYINPYSDPNGPPYINHRDRSKHPSKLVAKKYNEDIYRIYNMLSAHSVLILNPEYTNFLNNAIDIAIINGGHQDVIRASTMPYWNVYALDTPLFYQGGNAEWRTRIRLSDLSQGDITENLQLL